MTTHYVWAHSNTNSMLLILYLSRSWIFNFIFKVKNSTSAFWSLHCRHKLTVTHLLFTKLKVCFIFSFCILTHNLVCYCTLKLWGRYFSSHSSNLGRSDDDSFCTILFPAKKNTSHVVNRRKSKLIKLTVYRFTPNHPPPTPRTECENMSNTPNSSFIYLHTQATHNAVYWSVAYVVLSLTPSTGLQHPSSKEGGTGKWCSECGLTVDLYIYIVPWSLTVRYEPVWCSSKALLGW